MKKTAINTVLTLVGFAAVGFAATQGIRYFFFKKQLKKEEEETSSFSGSKNLKTITFKLKNNTNQAQVEYLFDGFGGKDNPNVSVSGNLDDFNRELTNIPKIVKKIEFRAKQSFSGIDGEEVKPSDEAVTTDLKSSGAIIAERTITKDVADDGTATEPVEKSDIVIAPTQDSADAPEAPEETVIEEPIVAEAPQYNQAEAPFKIICKDASGNASTTQYLPLVAATQYQSNITSVKFKNLILDGVCLMKYTMYPNAEVSIIVYYEDIKPSKLLKK